MGLNSVQPSRLKSLTHLLGILVAIFGQPSCGNHLECNPLQEVIKMPLVDYTDKDGYLYPITDPKNVGSTLTCGRYSCTLAIIPSNEKYPCGPTIERTAHIQFFYLIIFCQTWTLSVVSHSYQPLSEIVKWFRWRNHWTQSIVTPLHFRTVESNFSYLYTI